MPHAAYVVGQITIKHPEKWAEYRSKVPGSLEGWGAELVFRGVRSDVLGGTPGHRDIVVIRFPDRESALGWFGSPAYQALVPLREAAAEVDLAVYSA